MNTNTQAASECRAPEKPTCEVCELPFDTTPQGCACDAWTKCACGAVATVIAKGVNKPQCAKCAE